MGGDFWAVAPTDAKALFRSTPPHGGRPPSSSVLGPCDGVSIHAPAWGATRGSGRTPRAAIGLFRSTPPHGGRPRSPSSAARDPSFDPRPRMGGDERRERCRSFRAGFDPRPRMGGDQGVLVQHRSGVLVSIHAPAWGATPEDLRKYALIKFLSTPPHGGRQPVCDMNRRCGVSIHAPAWGATVERWALRSHWTFAVQFRSTPPHGGRRRMLVLHRPSDGFDPRPRMGGDLRVRGGRGMWRGFDPRPRMGGDPKPTASHARSGECFDPRPRMGGDARVRHRLSTFPGCFDPRPRMGGDPR